MAQTSKLKPVDKVWVDGQLVPFKDAQVHVLTHTLHYGVGAFEGIRCYKRADGRGAIFRLAEHIEPVSALVLKYADRPMSLADGCLVRMAEMHGRHAILTLDSDFTIYRKHGREPIALIRP